MTLGLGLWASASSTRLAFYNCAVYLKAEGSKALTYCYNKSFYLIPTMLYITTEAGAHSNGPIRPLENQLSSSFGGRRFLSGTANC
jgi:hypothetical protein